MRLLRLGLVLLLGLDAACAQTGKPSPAILAEASAAMRDGFEAVRANDLPAAHRSFARAAALLPSIAPAHAALGSVLLAQGELSPAQKELFRAHQLDPADASTTLNLARTESSLGHQPAALKLFQQVQAAPNPPVFSADEALAYATSLAASGQNDSARTQLAEALTRTPDSVPLEDALGTLLAQAGVMDQALPHLQHAVELDPQLAQAQLHLGAALLALDRPQEALTPLRAAAAAQPSSFEAQLQLGRALSGLRQDAEALGILHRAVLLCRPDTPISAVYALALALQASGDAPGSLPLFASTAPTLGAAALTNYAVARVQTGDAAGALPLYARALALGPDSATLREDYGVAFLQQAELDSALTQFRAGLALQPDDPHLHYDLGLALKLKDDLTAAIPELERAAALDPTLPDPAYTLGVLYMQQGRYPEAAAQLRKATTLQPNNGEAWALLGGVLKDSNDDPGAVDALHHAVALQPDQPSLHVQLAALLVKAGQPEQAAAERKTAAELSRAAVSHQRASFALKSGRTLLTEGKLPEAVVQLNAAAQADPTLAEPHTLLAEALTRQGKPAEAALERQKASTLRPGTP
jgi:protein O-GlcNAc transferase